MIFELREINIHLTNLVIKKKLSAKTNYGMFNVRFKDPKREKRPLVIILNMRIRAFTIKLCVNKVFTKQ